MVTTTTHASGQACLLAPLLNAAKQKAPASTYGARPAAADAREQLLAFLSLNTHFSTADIADLRELLTHYPPHAVCTAVQRACQDYLKQRHAQGYYSAAEENLCKILVSPLLHFAVVNHLPALAA